MPTIGSIQNIVGAYNQQLKFKERLASIKKVETQQVQKDRVTISKEGRKLFEEGIASKDKIPEGENISNIERDTTITSE